MARPRQADLPESEPPWARTAPGLPCARGAPKQRLADAKCESTSTACSTAICTLIFCISLSIGPLDALKEGHATPCAHHSCLSAHPVNFDSMQAVKSTPSFFSCGSIQCPRDTNEARTWQLLCGPQPCPLFLSPTLCGKHRCSQRDTAAGAGIARRRTPPAAGPVSYGCSAARALQRETFQHGAR